METAPNPINAVKAAKKKLEYYTKKKSDKNAVHLVLFQLCQQVDVGQDSIVQQENGANDDPLVNGHANADAVHDCTDEDALCDSLVAQLDSGRDEASQVHFSPRY